jgi:fructose/tagatose bisphosphate aldolase
MTPEVPKWILDAGGAVAIMILIVFFMKILTGFVREVKDRQSLVPVAVGVGGGNERRTHVPCIQAQSLALHFDHTETACKEISAMKQTFSSLDQSLKGMKENAEQQTELLRILVEQGLATVGARRTTE